VRRGAADDESEERERTTTHARTLALRFDNIQSNDRPRSIEEFDEPSDRLRLPQQLATALA